MIVVMSEHKLNMMLWFSSASLSETVWHSPVCYISLAPNGEPVARIKPYSSRAKVKAYFSMQLKVNKLIWQNTLYASRESLKMQCIKQTISEMQCETFILHSPNVRQINQFDLLARDVFKMSKRASLQRKHRNVTFLPRVNSQNDWNHSESGTCPARAGLRKAQDARSRVPSIRALPIQCKHYSIIATKQGGAQGFQGGQHRKNTPTPVCDACETAQNHGNPRRRRKHGARALPDR